MGNPYGKILTGAGLIQGGKLTKAAKDKYVDEVLGLLVTGNADGKGGSPSTKIFNSLFPLPPIPGPVIPNVTTLQAEPVFWFGPDPIAALMATQLKDPKNNPFWHKIWPDLIYEKTAVALDANGSTPLFPIMDFSAVFDIDLPFPITIPDLALKLNIMPPPKLLLKLADLGIELKIPVPPIPPIPPDFGFPDFSLPGIPYPGLPSLALPDLALGLIKLPFDLILKLVAPPDLGLVLDLPGLPLKILELAFKIVLDLLGLLIVPKIFVASLLIYVKNVVAMVCTDLVGMLVGAGGSLTKLIAKLTGLI
jgi:hypothetical protein